MNTFSKKSLHVALAGLGALGLANTADAVMVNPDGLGQVLIYPYYTVRSDAAGHSYNTLLSIVNTTASTKAVKVRFREGKASAEVLDFNLFLSPHDVWTAAVVPNGTDGAAIQTADHSCTIPTIGDSTIPFRTTQADLDAIGPVAGRVTEGYFEVFEMATYGDTDPIHVDSLHDSTGFPASCAGVTDAAAGANPLPPTGGLAGGAMLINVETGDEFAQNATALAQFWDPTATTGNYFNTGDTRPDAFNAFAVASVVNQAGQVVGAGFANGALATTAALQRQAVINEFVLDNLTASQTDWVMTFPTKHELVTSSAATPPFSSPLSTSGSCDDATLVTYNREEKGVTPSGPDFSPSPQPSGFALCWEANVISFNGHNLLGSMNRYDVTTGFENGWAKLTWGPSAINVAAGASTYNPFTNTLSAASTTFTGLPVIGFAAQSFTNGSLSTAGGIDFGYGASFAHRYIGPQ